MSRVIRVWQFKNAPAKLRALSHHGGDEDWVAVVPSCMQGVKIPWLDPGSPFGCCDVSVHALADGRVVYIGAHS